MKNKQWGLIFAASFCLVFLTACGGWHLRGAVTLPTSLQPLQILPNDPYSPLQRNLHLMLRVSGITIAKEDSGKDDQLPNSVLTLLQEQFKTDPATIGIDGQVKENKITYTLTFQLDDRKGQPLLKPQTITLSRIVFFNTNAILSSNTTEAAQQNDLRLEAINQMLRQLARVNPP